jgi:integrase/recombinase XerC
MMPTQLPSIEIEIVAANVSADLVSTQKWRESLWAEFGQLKIADSTRKQYVKAIENFCQFAYNVSATYETISEFLALDQYAAIEMVLRYRRHSIDRKLAPSTINVRLAAIKPTFR